MYRGTLIDEYVVGGTYPTSAVRRMIKTRVARVLAVNRASVTGIYVRDNGDVVLYPGTLENEKKLYSVDWTGFLVFCRRLHVSCHVYYSI